MRDPQSPAPEPTVDPGPEIARQLAFDLSEVAWAAPEKIRARARRRTQVRVLAGAVPVVVVLALVFGYVAPVGTDERPAPPAGPTPSSTPVVRITGVEIPPEALLQPDDVGPGLVTAPFVAWPNNPRLFVPRTTRCNWGPPEVYSSPRTPYNTTLVQNPPARTVGGNADRWLMSQWVYRASVEAAGIGMEELRQRVRECGMYESTGSRRIGMETRPVESTNTWMVRREGFAGDESLLVEHQTFIESDEVDPVPVRMYMAVRVGDLFTMITLLTDDRQRAEALTARAIERLCVAANPGC
ncbi:hypothetical protein AB0I61_29815 [Polymorphospora rubra]|uniref:hypothetical protein n=1 Tax=Polymorphospora rubra TaxID=338584 RepID=UPI0033FE2080